MSEIKFNGWVAHDKDAVNGNLKWGEYEPKPFTADDVTIKVTHCGICASDLHTLRSGWGPSLYPQVVGHEIVGIALEVGDNVKHVKKGDRVGIGAQSGSCLKPDCGECMNGRENYCSGHKTNTYNGTYMDGSKSFGGYADYHRAPGHFVFKIPDGIPSAEAAPMLCGGITTFTPLIRNGAGPGKNVAIVGVGGLGHFGLLWAKALGCSKVYAISRSRAKEADARKMGADEFIATDEDEDWAEKHASSLDLIVSTVSSPKMPIQGYLDLLRIDGEFIQVGAPEDIIPGFNAFALITKGAKIGGSSIGSPEEIRKMLDFAEKHKVHPWIQERDMKEANEAVLDMDKGKARYRYSLVNRKNL